MFTKTAARWAARLRTPVVVRARRVVASIRRRSTPTSTTTEQQKAEICQLLLFGDGGRAKRDRQPKPKAKRVKGCQYRLKLSFRATPRKIAYRSHARKEEEVNSYTWSEDGMYRLHSILLNESLQTLRAMCERKSVRAAEIIAWMFRGNPSETFSFEECCRLFKMELPDPENGELVEVGQQDPDVLRNQARLWIRKAYGAELPQAKVMRQAILDAEVGNEDAIAWILSDQEAPLSFRECADALGFDAEDARKEVKLRTTIVDPLERGIDEIIDRVFGQSYQMAIAV